MYPELNCCLVHRDSSSKRQTRHRFSSYPSTLLGFASTTGMNYNLPPDESAVGTGNFLPFDRYGVLANFRRTCDNPESITLSQACLLWRKIRGGYYQGPLTSLPCTQGEQCYQTQDGKHTLLATSANDPAHYLLMPGSKAADWPVIGIEDRQVLSPALEHIWDLAWLLAFKPYQQLPFLPFGSEADLPVSVTSCNIGIALDPASTRSQHQLHLHIARIPSTLRRLFVGRFDNYATWTKLRVPITRKLESEWPIAYARYFDLSAASHGDLGGLDNAGIDPFTTTSNSGTARNGSPRMGGPGRYGIFHQAFSFANFDPLYMQAWGLLLIPDEEPIDLRDEHARLPRGFYLVLSTNNMLGTWNPFQNTTETQNDFFAPELLLCSSYSAGDGQFWTQEECYGQAPKAVRFAVQNGTYSHFSDLLIAQQRSQDAL